MRRAVLLTGLISFPVHAGPSIGATRPEIDASIGDTARGQSIADAFYAGIARAVPVHRLSECEGDDCELAAARAAGVEYIVAASVTRPVADSGDFAVRLTVRSANGDTVVETENLCELCGDAELAGMVEEMAASLQPRLERLDAMATLSVRGEPDGATVLVDGEQVGSTPTDLQLAPGEHRIEIRLRGHATQQRDVVSVGGTTESWDYRLQEVDTGSATTDRRGFVGWALVGIGAAAVGPGIAFMALHGRNHGPSCEPRQVDRNGACPRLWNSMGAGVATTVAGVGAIAAGVGLVVVARKRSSGNTISVGPQPGGARLRIRF